MPKQGDTRWLTSSKIATRYYEEILRKDENREVFTKEFFDDLSKKKEEAEKRYWKTTFIWGVLFFALVLSSFGNKPEISILGMNIKGLETIKELLLFAASSLSFYLVFQFSSVEAMKALLKAMLNVYAKDEFRNVLQLRYVDQIGDAGSVIPSLPKHHRPGIFGIAHTLGVAAGILCSFLIYLGLVLTAHFWVITEIWQNPSIDIIWNRAICLLAISASLTWALIATPIQIVDSTKFIQLAEQILNSAGLQTNKLVDK